MTDHRTRSADAVRRAHERLQTWAQDFQDHIQGVKDVHDKIVVRNEPYTAKDALADGIALTVSWYDLAFGWLYPGPGAGGSAAASPAASAARTSNRTGRASDAPEGRR